MNYAIGIVLLALAFGLFTWILIVAADATAPEADDTYWEAR